MKGLVEHAASRGVRRWTAEAKAAAPAAEAAPVLQQVAAAGVGQKSRLRVADDQLTGGRPIPRFELGGWG